MPVWRLQTEFSMDSTLPRDVLSINPHFDTGSSPTGPQGLCDDWAEAMDTWSGRGMQIAVTAYDAEGTPPVDPQGETILNVGAAPASAVPREIAVCLSFYSVRNAPRSRGRLFMPFPVFNLSTQQTAGRPNETVRQYVGDVAALAQELGGLGTDWVIWSPTDSEAKPVTNWWVDDEWDTIRSRGLRPTTRLEGTTDEA